MKQPGGGVFIPRKVGILQVEGGGLLRLKEGGGLFRSGIVGGVLNSEVGGGLLRSGSKGAGRTGPIGMADTG